MNNYQLRQKVLFRLSGLTTRKLTKLGLGADPVCGQEIEKMLSVGVSRLEHQRALDREEQLVVAEENLSRLLNALSERAQSLGTYPTVDGDAFNQVKKRLAPMWPFL